MTHGIVPQPSPHSCRFSDSAASSSVLLTAPALNERCMSAMTGLTQRERFADSGRTMQHLWRDLGETHGARFRRAVFFSRYGAKGHGLILAVEHRDG